MRPLTRPGRWLVAFLLGVAAWLTGCGERTPTHLPDYAATPPASEKTVWVLAVHPLHNPGLLQELYGPLLVWANARLPDLMLRLEASNDYGHFETKLRERGPELVLPNPYQTVQARDWGYRVVAKVAGDDDFHGLVLRRKGWRPPPAGQPIVVSCPSLTALAACMLPRWQLHLDGLDATHPIEVRVVGSQESSILNVAQGLVDLGLTWPPPWRLFQAREPAQAAGLEVDRRSMALINNGVMAREDLDPQQVQRVVQALQDLSADEEGRRRLAAAGIAGFEPADNATYDGVEGFLRDYQQVFGRLP